MRQELETVRHNDRTVTKQTKWWAELVPSYANLYCVHGKLLREDCAECDKEK